MAVKIRLMRIGAKKRPFYRVVAVDERKKRTGGYLELLGTYNPLTEPKEIILKKDRIDFWIKQGAVMSVGYLRIIGQAPQKLPQKPKKEPKGQAASTPKKEETEEPKTEEDAVVKNEEAAAVPVEEKAAEAPEEKSEETAAN